MIGAGGTVYWAQDYVRHRLPRYLETQLSSALGRPVTVGKVAFWPPPAFSVRDVRVAPGPGETEPLLVAGRVRTYISWWDLLVHRQLRLTELHVDDARIAATVDLTKTPTTEVNPASQLLSLSRFGLSRLGLHKSSLHLTTLLPGGERQPVTAQGLDFETDLKRDHLDYRIRASDWSGVGMAAHDVAIEGRGDTRAITIAKSRIRFEGGTLAAKGSYVTHGSDVAMQVQVRELPVGNLAPQLGIPKEWGVQGKLTGLMEVSAGSGALRRIHGTLRVSPGAVSHSKAVFPWTMATSDVDWTPASVSLRNIDIEGNGFRLRGTSDVSGKAATPMLERPYSASGTVEATSTEAVTRLAQLMAYQAPVLGQWSVGHGAVTFQARGIVGRLQDSRANGHFEASEVVARPNAKGLPLRLQTVQGDLDRFPDHLHVRNIKATAEGLTAQGNLTVTPTRPGREGTFSTAGRMDLVSLRTFQQQLPDAPFWKWISPANPNSRGSLTLAASGFTRMPEKTRGSGQFRFREFSASVPTGAGNQRWSFPVRDLTGRLALQGARLAVNDVALRSDLFTGAGQGYVEDSNKVWGAFRLASDHWTQLPPIQARIPAGLSGGVLTLEAWVPAPVAAPDGQSQEAATALRPLAGTATLRGATYRTAVGGQTKSVLLQASTAEFRLAGDQLTVPAYRLVTPQFQTSGSATGHQRVTAGKTGTEWLIHAGGTLVAANAGELARWMSKTAPLDGGKLNARYVADLSSADPKRATVTARLRLTDAQPHLPAGALPFKDEEARIKSLTGRFHYAEGTVRFSDAVWQAPRFSATGSGTFDGHVLNAAFGLSTGEWRRLAGELARTLPVEGGTLTVQGRVNGPVNQLSAAPVDGTATLRGAHLAIKREASAPIQGGVLDLKTRVRGPLTQLVGAKLDGAFSLRDLPLPGWRRGAAPVRIELATGKFHRNGTSVDLSDLVARAPGVRMSGRGELRGVGTNKASHSFSFATEGPALAKVLPALAPVPGKASGGKFTGSLTLAGTAADPIARMEGRAEVRDGSWTPPGQTVAMKISRMAAHFVRNGSTATLDNVEFRTPDGEATLTGTMQGLGTASGPRHDLRVRWDMKDASAWASRFFPIPGWFSGGLFTGEARLEGSGTDPAQTASGKFELKDTGFMPPQQFLGGPARPVQVRWAKGIFSRAARKTTLSDLDLNTSVGTATGRVVSDDRGLADVTARAEITKLDDLIDLWPGFKNRVRGGRGELTVALQGPLRRPREFAGTVNITGKGGVLKVENVDEIYATQPFDVMNTRMKLGSGGRVTLEQVTMHGPKANMEGRGVITAAGQVQGDGKAWFTEQFTRKLVKPRFLWPVAKLVGLRRLKSDFTVRGSLREARLDMSITRTALWRVAIKRKVPEPLRRIATGDVPLWSVGGYEPNRTRTASAR
jgi:hypothetical protein